MINLEFSVFSFPTFGLFYRFLFAFQFFQTGIVLKILPEKFALGNLHAGSQNCLKLIFFTAVLSVCLCM